MAQANEPFQFLGDDEFGVLSPDQKMAYLKRASETINRRSAETHMRIAELLKKLPPTGE